MLPVIRFALAEFAPLIAFWALALAFNVKVAIAGALAAILLDAALRLWRGLPFTRIYLIVSTLTLAFGAVDLSVQTPFLLVYEAPITNALTGAAFVVGAFGKKPIVQEMAEARGADVPTTPEARRFFRLFTLLWALYFFLKAALYLWLAATLPLKQALALRSLIGGISLGLMIALSATQGRRLFFLCRRLGWLGVNEVGGMTFSKTEMTLSKTEAGAELAAIEGVVARLKQSRIYRVSADIVILWGALQMVQYALVALLPVEYGWAWIAVDALGVAATFFLLWRVRPGNPLTGLRVLGAYALFYGFGFVWSEVIGHFEGHAVAAFWHTLFLFGFSIAGLWFGLGFLVIGVGLSAAILAIYFFAGALFWPLIAVVSGGGYILCGLWMRRA